MWVEYPDLLMKNGMTSGAYTVTGNGLAFLAGRVSYTFGLTGPCVPTNTACSSSLVATHLASTSISQDDCHMATASGVNAILVPEGGFAAVTQVRALAVDGRCKSFGAEGDGYGRGEVRTIQKFAFARLPMIDIDTSYCWFGCQRPWHLTHLL